MPQRVVNQLLDILDCRMDDLIEPVAAADAGRKPRKAATGGTAAESIGDLRPKRARIVSAEQ